MKRTPIKGALILSMVFILVFSSTVRANAGKSEKRYTIDTICESDIYVGYNRIESDSIAVCEDCIYTYEKDHCLYKTSISSRKKDEFINLDDWYNKKLDEADGVDADNIYNGNWEFLQIYYSENQKTLYLLLKIENEGACLFSYNDSTFTLVAKGLKTTRLLCDLPNGNAFENYNDFEMYKMNLTTGRESKLSDTIWGYPLNNAAYNNGSLYFSTGFSDTNSFACKYDFADANSFLTCTNKIFVTGSYLYIPDIDQIKRYSFDGYQKSSIKFDNIEVDDATGLTQNIGMIHARADDSIIIYDIDDSSLRLISKN